VGDKVLEERTLPVRGAVPENEEDNAERERL
jgi:hypothetical protein